MQDSVFKDADCSDTQSSVDVCGYSEIVKIVLDCRVFTSVIIISSFRHPPQLTDVLCT